MQTFSRNIANYLKFVLQMAELVQQIFPKSAEFERDYYFRYSRSSLNLQWSTADFFMGKMPY